LCLPMKIRVLHHDHCFDGSASAAFFSRFLEDQFYPQARFEFGGLAHKASQLFEDSLFDGEVNAIVDFKYSTNPKLTWWFDHHQSAFLSAEDAEHYREHKDTKKLYFNPEYRSCTKFIADITREKYDYTAPDLDELVKWADIIDGAQYDSAEVAVAMREPAMKLTLVIEASKAHGTVSKVIRLMRTHKLGEIMEQPEIREIFQPLYERHLESIGIIRKEATCSNGVIFFDVSGYDMEGYNKFIPYSLHPEATYNVSVSLASFRSKVSVGSNPWAPAEPTHNLATICERYGGGGHPRVGAISFERNQVEEARRVAQEIVAELQS
jgi:oligoribonuclease NrnB/cAMP/cGMP phosphodiesterase (DHH superfamily)